MIPSDLIKLKEERKFISVLTAWDYWSGGIVEKAGADVVLIGDSLAMICLGHPTTLPVTLDEMLHHAKAVSRGFKRPFSEQPLLVCDLPFLSYQCGEDKAVNAAGKLLKNSRTSAVKIEGAEKETLKVINRLIRMGIPVMGHLGLTPQSINTIGYRKQAISRQSQEILFNQAIELEQNGCFSLVIEHVPEEISTKIKNKLKIPVIGIGAGDNCDGQVRVTADLLGLSDKQPPFVKPLIKGNELFINHLKDWIDQKSL